MKALGAQFESFFCKTLFSFESPVREQIAGALEGVSAAKAKSVIIAYEPVWAIGTGISANPDDTLSVRLFIQKVLRKLYSKSIQESIPIIYGGSTSSKNLRPFL